MNIDALEGMLSGYEADGDAVGKMVTMRELGKIYRESSDFKTALNYHKTSLSLAKELKDTANIIFILNQLEIKKNNIFTLFAGQLAQQAQVG